MESFGIPQERIVTLLSSGKVIFNMNNAPRSVGIILDGNRRWAKAKGLSTLEGHRAGLAALEQTVGWAREAGVEHLAVYVFSTENWNRAEEEVSHLMRLFEESVRARFKELAKSGVRIRCVGQLERFSLQLQQAMREAEEESAKNGDITLWACLSYGGRAEIAAAAQKAAAGGMVTESSLAERLWSADMPDLDIVIRTGGEKRLSGFMTWKSTYSELFFLDVMWPDFSKADFDKVLREFVARERRMGA